jgi:hypothetical protein
MNERDRKMNALLAEQARIAAQIEELRAQEPDHNELMTELIVAVDAYVDQQGGAPTHAERENWIYRDFEGIRIGFGFEHDTYGTPAEPVEVTDAATTLSANFEAIPTAAALTGLLDGIVKGRTPQGLRCHFCHQVKPDVRDHEDPYEADVNNTPGVKIRVCDACYDNRRDDL